MAPLGPFGTAPRMVAGVSGGPHSLALALLADRWLRPRGGALLAGIVDHGLRPESGAEADGVRATLDAKGIAARVLRLELPGGAGLQDRAREARLRSLLTLCAGCGAPWLLLGHHLQDQAETVLLRALAGSGPAGLAGMAPVRSLPEALVLRPLLGMPPGRLEALLAAEGLHPVRDPSNRDPRFTRVRLRAALARAPEGTAALAEAAGRLGGRREALEARVAARLAEAASLHPLGFVRLNPDSLGRDAVAVAALAATVRLVGGERYLPPAPAAAALLARGEGTLHGARLMPARGGWVALREEAAMAEPVPAEAGAVWDGRFRLDGPGLPGAELGALGAAPGLQRPAWLPAAVARTLPALRHNGTLVAVAGLFYPGPISAEAFRITFAPGGGPLP